MYVCLHLFRLRRLDNQMSKAVKPSACEPSRLLPLQRWNLRFLRADTPANCKRSNVLQRSLVRLSLVVML